MPQELNYKPLYRDWLQLSYHLLWCYERDLENHPEGFSGYNNNGAWLVRHGWVEVEHDGQCWRAGSGQWLIVKPAERIQRFGTKTRILSVSFDAQWPDGSSLIKEGLSLVLDANQYPALERLALPLVQSIRHVAIHGWDARREPIDFYRYMQLQSHVTLWLRALVSAVRDQGVELRIRQNIDERVLKAVRMIDECSLAEPIDVESLAKLLGTSPAHLSRLFNEQLRITPVAYQTQLRVEQAKRRLHVSGVRVKEVALELGFMHLSLFSRWFKRYVGMSPREFVRKVR